MAFSSCRRSPYGERGLKSPVVSSVCGAYCRSPYGERGLKSAMLCLFHSRSLRRSPYGERGLKFGMWGSGDNMTSRSPYGERGLKYEGIKWQGSMRCRSPYGERGLKSNLRFRGNDFIRSLSLRRAWIEMVCLPHSSSEPYVALLTESVD